MKKTNQRIDALFLVLIVLPAVLLFNAAVNANNLTVSDMTLTGQDTTSDFMLVEFDIAWENSWRVSSGPSNWDAAWVFIKYRRNSETRWYHATLNFVDGTGSGDGHTVPANALMDSKEDDGAGGAYGVFIYRDSDFPQADVVYNDVRLRWNYGIDGVADDDSIEVCVFGIEMVYVPQNSFYVGDGSTQTDVQGAFELENTGNPFHITSEGILTLGGNTPGSMCTYGMAMTPPDDFNDATSKTLPAEFPKGYDGFYCMKYELHQQGYVDFLNKLDAAQAANRENTSETGWRHALTGTTGNFTTSNPYVAAAYLSWADARAFLDWAALRPMTELEYEKACRGAVFPVPDEYAWGSDSIVRDTFAMNNMGMAHEGISLNYLTTGGNAAYEESIYHKNGIQGPLRVGIFAANTGNTGRVTSGATYYGIMEMSGNIWEQVVSVGSAQGRAFTGEHGDGNLDASGDANASNWPGTNAVGAGLRGGCFVRHDMDIRVSDRSLASYSVTIRSGGAGIRGVRSMP